MLHSYMSVVYIYYYRGVFKNCLVQLLYSVDLSSRLSYRKPWTSNFVYTKLPPKWKNSILLTRQLHLLQWYIQAILCMYKTEYITSVMTVTFYLPLTFLSSTVFKTVRKANKQINRRQWKKGNYRLHHSVEKRSQNI